MKDLFRRVVVCQGQRIINNVIIKKRRKNRGQFGKKNRVGGRSSLIRQMKSKKFKKSNKKYPSIQQLYIYIMYFSIYVVLYLIPS